MERSENTETEMFNIEDCRIRKLTGKECYRLMGFTDKDYERARKVISESMIIHTAGDSIVTHTLSALIKPLI